jgi:hypothetical protein
MKLRQTPFLRLWRCSFICQAGASWREIMASSLAPGTGYRLRLPLSLDTDYGGIPPEIRVNSFQWFVHRDPNKWAHIDEWMPKRWLGADENDQQGENGVLQPLGS